jgi:hypothetical protein
VPTTFLQTTFFYESFIVGGQGPHRDENGELVLTNPMAGNKMALIAADDIGKTALGVFRRGDEFTGKTVSIAGAHVTGEQLAAKFTAVLGEKVVSRPLTHDQVRASGQPGALEIANTYQFYSDASEYFTGVRDLNLVRELNPDLQSLDSWLNEHKARSHWADRPPGANQTNRLAMPTGLHSCQDDMPWIPREIF